MSIGYSYGQLSAALQAWAENTAADFQGNMADIMQKGELRLYHALDLDNLDPIVSCGPVNGVTGIILKPASLIRERTLSLLPPTIPSTASMLLHFDGASGSTLFVDSSFETVWSPNNGANISTVNPKFGTGCFAPDATTGTFPYVTGVATIGGALDFGSADFTLEGQFLLNGNNAGGTSMNIIDLTNGFLGGFRIYITNTGGQNFALTAQGAGGTNISMTTSTVSSQTTEIALNTWHHWAFVRNGLNYTMYLDGVPGFVFTGVLGTVGTGYSGTWFITGGYLAAVQKAGWNGSLDEMRATQGVAIYTAAFTPPTAPFANPTNPAAGALAVLNKRTYEFVTQYLLDNGINQSQPKYYAENDIDHWQLAPLPDQVYSLNVRGIFRPTLLGDNPETTNLAGIAASAHLVANTAMTLTTSPFVYAANVPSLPSSQVWIFSAGNLSANSFTIVGLDDDGNAQSETVVGPSAGSVQSIGYYSSITSITPALTDAVQFASVGWSQDNQTWLSSRFGDLLFWYCMSEACQFNKRWTAAKEAEAKINALLPFAQMITRTLKRNDFDDLYSGRQNVGAPGAVPLPVPPQTGVQQGGAGQP